MSDFDENDNHEDDILTVEEEKKIAELVAIKELNSEKKMEKKVDLSLALGAMMGGNGGFNLGAQLGLSKEPAPFSFGRRLGLYPVVTVNNISGKRAWLILSPAPIVGVSSVGLEKVGQISFSTAGDYKCQQSSLSDQRSYDFELDNYQVYYTVFFDCDGKWKTPFKNRKINTKKYNINLLERHVNDSLDANFVPVN
jgi:hypothetical protein